MVSNIHTIALGNQGSVAEVVKEKVFLATLKDMGIEVVVPTKKEIPKTVQEALNEFQGEQKRPVRRIGSKEVQARHTNIKYGEMLKSGSINDLCKLSAFKGYETVLAKL